MMWLTQSLGSECGKAKHVLTRPAYCFISKGWWQVLEQFQCLDAVRYMLILPSNVVDQLLTKHIAKNMILLVKINVRVVRSEEIASIHTARVDASE